MFRAARALFRSREDANAVSPYELFDPPVSTTRDPAPLDRPIPKIIFQTFKASRVRTRMRNAMATWIEHNPGYEYRFFDDEGCRSLIRDQFGTRVAAAFDRIPPGAYRADLWRYCALHAFGGVYADVDMVCRRPLDLLIRANDELIVAQGQQPGFLFNAFICARPRHPVFERVIAHAMQLTLSGDARHWFDIVGPSALGTTVNTMAGREARTRHTVGRHHVGEFRFRVLRKIVGPRVGPPLFHSRVLDGIHTILWCTYKGYYGDLRAAGVHHWTSISGGPPEPA